MPWHIIFLRVPQSRFKIISRYFVFVPLPALNDGSYHKNHSAPDQYYPLHFTSVSFPLIFFSFHPVCFPLMIHSRVLSGILSTVSVLVIAVPDMLLPLGLFKYALAPAPDLAGEMVTMVCDDAPHDALKIKKA